MKRSLVPLFAPIFVALFGLAAVAFICGAGTYMPGVPPIETPLGKRLPFFFLFPFVALLAAIACLPALAGHWWEENVNKAKVAALAALPIAALLPFHFGRTGFDALLENVAEYVSLMALLVALFTVCGGIVIEGTPRGTPFVNAGILAIGAVLANFIGTTGDLDDPDPAVAARQRASPQDRAHSHLRDLHRGQLRRAVDAAGRSAAVSGIFGGRPLRVDVQALSRLGRCERSPVGDLRRARLVRLVAGEAPNDGTTSATCATPAALRGRAQENAPRRSACAASQISSCSWPSSAWSMPEAAECSTAASAGPSACRSCCS